MSYSYFPLTPGAGVSTFSVSFGGGWGWGGGTMATLLSLFKNFILLSFIPLLMLFFLFLIF